MRAGHAIPMFAAAFLLGANVVGTVDTVRFRVREAVSTTTTYSAPLEGAPAPSGQGDATIHAATLDAVKAKLPKSGPAALPVEIARIAQPRKNKTLVFVAPTGWKSENDMMPGYLERPGSSGFGNHNSVDVSWTCEGVCAPKDWKSIVDAKAKKRVADGPGTHDEMLPGNRRIRWGIDENGASVYAAWFEEGASELNECSVWLQDRSLHPALDAFVEMCKTAKIEKT